MNVAVIVAGTNEPSNCDMLANAFIGGIKDADVNFRVSKIRLKDLNVRHFTLDDYGAKNDDEEDFCKIRRLMGEADGVVIATPIWNFGVPAHLKNLIDRMGEFALNQTKSTGTLGGKPFYLIFTGGAPKPAWKSIMRRTTSFIPEGLRYFGASIIGSHFEGRCTVGKGKFGLVVDKRPKSLNSMRHHGSEFAGLVAKYAKTGKLPVRKSVIRKLYSIGQYVIGKLT